MKYRTFGKLGIRGSAFGLGCMRFNGEASGDCTVDEEKAISLIRRAIDGGVTYVDTAYVYLDKTSETILGKALRDGYREKVTVATKMPAEFVHNRAEMEALLAEEQPEFSGFVRYDASCALEKDAALRLRVDGAEEGVEVFLNGESQEIQIAPPFVYDLSGKTGENHLRIEVATTLERECYPMLEGYKKMLAKKPSCASGITGKVTLRQLKD